MAVIEEVRIKIKDIAEKFDINYLPYSCKYDRMKDEIIMRYV